MPPTHFDGGNVNMFQPYVVGQSGTESPESVLVTRLPARTRRTVQPATNFAKRCSIAGITRREGQDRQDGQDGKSCLSRPAYPAYPAPPALVSRNRRFEREVRALGFLRGDRHL